MLFIGVGIGILQVSKCLWYDINICMISMHIQRERERERERVRERERYVTYIEVQSAYDENCLAFWGQSIVFHMYRCFLYGH